MADTRLQRLAQVLVRYSLGIKNGDRFAISSQSTRVLLQRRSSRNWCENRFVQEDFLRYSSICRVWEKLS